MGFHVTRLNRPYDYRVLIETYIYTQREGYIHSDFEVYYALLLESLQKEFGVRLSHEGLATVPLEGILDAFSEYRAILAPDHKSVGQFP